jgi:hypothetical protein
MTAVILVPPGEDFELTTDLEARRAFKQDLDAIVSAFLRDHHNAAWAATCATPAGRRNMLRKFRDRVAAIIDPVHRPTKEFA